MNKFLLITVILLMFFGCQKPEKEITYNIRYDLEINPYRDFTSTTISYYYNGNPHTMISYGAKNIQIKFYTTDPFIKFHMICKNPAGKICGKIYITSTTENGEFWNNNLDNIVELNPINDKVWYFERVLD